MLYKTRAIVLNHIKYGDSSLIVRVLTEKLGRQSFLVHGVRKKKNKINPYLFEPLSILKVDLYYKQNRDLHTLKDVKPEVILHQLHFDIRRSTIAIFLSEIIHRSLQEVESNANLFDYLFNAIQILDVIDKGIENYHIIFLLHFSKFLGIYPKNNTELVQYNTTEAVQLIDLIDHPLSEIDQLNITPKNREKLIDQLIAYYQNHLEGMGNIKSLPVLRTIFE